MMSSEPAGAAGRSGRDLPMRLGGLMTLAAGVLSLMSAVLGTALGGELPVGVDFERFALCGVIVLAFGTVAVIGGICALMGKQFSLALAGAFLGMVSGGLVPFWLGLGALVVFALAHEDL